MMGRQAGSRGPTQPGKAHVLVWLAVSRGAYPDGRLSRNAEGGEGEKGWGKGKKTECMRGCGGPDVKREKEGEGDVGLQWGWGGAVGWNMLVSRSKGRGQPEGGTLWGREFVRRPCWR